MVLTARRESRVTRETRAGLDCLEYLDLRDPLVNREHEDLSDPLDLEDLTDHADLWALMEMLDLRALLDQLDPEDLKEKMDAEVVKERRVSPDHQDLQDSLSLSTP